MRTALSNCCNIGENQKLPASIFTGFVPLIAHGLRKELLVKPIILGSSFYYHFTANYLRFGYIWCSFDLQEFSTRYSQSYKAGHSTWKTRLTSIEVEPTISPRLSIYDLTTQVSSHLRFT